MTYGSGQSLRRGQFCDFKREISWIQFPLEKMKYFHSFVLVLHRAKFDVQFATQLAMPPEFGGKCGAECLNTRRPLPILHAESNIKLNKKTTDIRIVGQ